MRSALLITLSLVGVACSDLRPIPIPTGMLIVRDAGFSVDAGTTTSGCTLPFGGPDCCENGARVTSASCVASNYVCDRGALCECNGAAAAFHCVDVCGGDAFVSPTCSGTGWACPGGLIKTSDCAPGTCFGEPGDCCVSPSCVDGSWTCESISNPCE